MKLLSNIQQEDPRFQALIEQIRNAESLTSVILATFRLVFALGIKIVETELTERAQRPTDWPNCPKCGTRIHSKGLLPRSVMSILGEISWKRRVGRCPNRCHIEQIVPLDNQLGICPYQPASEELSHIACLLAVFVPYETAAVILRQILPIQLGAMTIWTWVQQYGATARIKLMRELDDLKQGITPILEAMNESILQLPLIIGADGVHAPFRPFRGSPCGKIVWREIKVGILARLGQRIKRNGDTVPKLEQRRLVATLGNIDVFRPQLWLEALRQGVLDTETVVWVSDGGRGFWNLFTACFASFSIGILDFYHAAQNIWKAAAAWLDGRTITARQWFAEARHELRHGSVTTILRRINSALLTENLSEDTRRILSNVHEYLNTHREHVDYSRFKEQMGLPIGSGVVESACKWLIQQRFKGVGMRWSEAGFENLLHLRLAWVNGRFDELFFPDSPSPN